ncbi:MAG: TonB-dependent receptor [uncultured Sphingosinicella sp.]|uniref:TonB-dependent receptor n=1 Tax=uncultured Sphingosinicella sp. TaxID=478748 RepID=A0A6J4TXY5_9SPHN|nr:TonB-dependent receptor [uncultured Sphingosinicella sp.]CAA9535460.1 MAG: TonB-dependent receptor [uncultured Sphingosinicella sp.]
MDRKQIFTALRLGTAFAALAAAAPGIAQVTSEQEQPAGTVVSSEQQAAAANEATEDQATTQDPDIVVTARRRAESLQDVPIAVTAYTGEALERQGAVDITDISDTTPNVTIETSRGTNTTLTAFIRGVGQQDPVAGFEAGVGLYLDDVFLNRPQAAVLDIYDVERIEVLRGPQGTLYGRNTIGGAIKYVTRRLDDDPTFRVRANLGTYKQADVIVSASAPLSEYIRIGTSVARLSRDGFGENLNNGLDNYNRDIYAARGTVELLPTADIFVRVSADYTRDYSDPRNGHRLLPGLVSGTPVLDDVYDTRAGLNSPRQDVKAYGSAMHIEAKASENITLKNILAYRKDRSGAPIDFDSLPAADVDVPAIYKNRQFSNEFQILYEGDRLQGVAGVYYLNANANNVFDVILATTAPAVLPGLTASTFGDVDTETWAVFGDFTFDVTEQLSLSVGGRYTNDKREARVIRANYLRGPSPALGGTGTQLGARTSDFTGEKTFKEFTPRASIAFEPNDENTVYATYSKGFKGGGFDPRGLSTAAPDLNGNGTREADEIFDYFLFDPEKVDSYEVGYKASLFDRKLRLAVAGFYADYKDVQVPGSVGAVINGVPTFVGVTTNAGKASFKGVETEFVATLFRDTATGSRLNFAGTLGYLDAQYEEFITNVPGKGPVDVAEFRRIQNTPKWTLSGTLDYSMRLAGGDLLASTTVSYRSKTFQFETPSPFLDQPGYALWDANLVWNSPDDRFSVGLHAKNILDKQYITSGYQFLLTDPVTGVPLRTAAGQVRPSLGVEGVATAFYGNPRQVFVSLGVNF